MSDIVEMLRTPTGCVPPTEWELKAAKEIERLQDALKEIAAKDRTGYGRGALGRIARTALSNGNRDTQ